MRTLSIDIGGTGIKALLLDTAGAPVSERLRVPTPQPATPEAVIAVIDELARQLGEHDRGPLRVLRRWGARGWPGARWRAGARRGRRRPPPPPPPPWLVAPPPPPPAGGGPPGQSPCASPTTG